LGCLRLALVEQLGQKGEKERDQGFEGEASTKIGKHWPFAENRKEEERREEENFPLNLLHVFSTICQLVSLACWRASSAASRECESRQ